MYIKPLSNSIHQRLMGRTPVLPSVKEQRRIAQYVSRFFPDGVSDNSPVVELPLPDWAPSQPELDSVITELAIPFIQQVLKWLTVETLPTPTNWDTPVGWSKWVKTRWVSVEQPPKDCYFTDIETVPAEWYQFSTNGKPEPTLWVPVCAVAVSLSDVYVWRADSNAEIDELDRLYPGVDGISVGHNIGYDQSYSALEHKANFEDWTQRPMAVDTMGLWMVTRGHCNQQRALVNLTEGWQPVWTEETTGASLADIYQFYFNEELPKGVRDSIVDEGWEFVRHNYSVVLEYCYNDNIAAAMVFQALMPEWIEANTYQGQTQWLTLWSMMLLSQSWAPMDESIVSNYFVNAETAYQAIKTELSQDLLDMAELVLKTDLDGTDERTEQLRSQLDWTVAKSGKNKGLPAWYRKLLKNPSIGSDMAPIILGFTWKGELLYYDKTKGFYTKSGRVDNPTKRGKPVHSMLMKDFRGDGRIGALTPIAEGILAKVHSTLIWTSLRKRVAGIHTYDLDGFPAYKDQLRPWGTVTRRSTSSITQVLPKMDKEGCVGSNIRAIFAPPTGYNFVAADFDSQELLLAAELGDAILDAYRTLGFRGSTPFSVACHIGEKATRSTPHYLLADSACIEYVLAKNINYGVIYGLSEKGIIDYFLMANKSMTTAEATERSRSTLAKQKGTKDRSTGMYYNGSASPTFNNLTRLVGSSDPRSLLSYQRLSKALSQAKGDYATTKQNWFIQEAGSSMRDRLVVYSWYLMQRYNIVGRLVMTVHDEAVYCVKECQSELMAYCLQLAHLYITAWKTNRFNLDSLPAGQSYFSSVEIDKHWRKSTKSNPPNTPDMTGVIWAKGHSLNPTELVRLIDEGSVKIM